MRTTEVSDDDVLMVKIIEWYFKYTIIVYKIFLSIAESTGYFPDSKSAECSPTLTNFYYYY
jgi:hypothetical protein